jgi:hypothetical protein
MPVLPLRWLLERLRSAETSRLLLVSFVFAAVGLAAGIARAGALGAPSQSGGGACSTWDLGEPRQPAIGTPVATLEGDWAISAEEQTEPESEPDADEVSTDAPNALAPFWLGNLRLTVRLATCPSSRDTSRPAPPNSGEREPESARGPPPV